MIVYTILIMGLLTLMVFMPTPEEKEADPSWKPYRRGWIALGLTTVLILLAAYHGGNNNG